MAPSTPLDGDPSRRLKIVLQHVVVAPKPNVSAGMCQSLSRREVNWSGNVRYNHERLVFPRSLAEIQTVVREARGHVRVVGRGHSFSPVSQVDGGTLVSLMQFSDILEYRPPVPGAFGSVSFCGGATYTDLAHFLKAQDPPAALRQTPSPLFVTVAGACATGTHGSGIWNRSLSSHVTEIELVTAEGSVVRFDRHDPDMNGAVVNVGCLGVVSRMALEVVPWFEVQVYRHVVPLEFLIENWHSIYVAGDDGRLLVDSASTWVVWHEGKAFVTSRHFVPHYDQSIAAEAPHWGDHPFHSIAQRWDLFVPRLGSFVQTVRSAGVSLNGNVVSDVEPGSMAAGAGISKGWVLAQIGLGPQQIGAVGPVTPMEAVDVGESGAEAVFASLPEIGTQGAQIMLTFSVGGALPEEGNSAWRSPWHDSMPVWPLGQACIAGPECEYGNQAEYFLPSEKGAEALRAAWDVLRTWSFCDQANAPIIDDRRGEKGYDLERTGILGIGELRCVKGDEDWISPCGSRDTVSFHISFNGHPKFSAEIERALPELERALEPFNARFHWGKLHTRSFYASRLVDIYGDGINRFRNLARRLDPTGKFRNSWADELIFSSPAHR